jgi:hypothetical protein
MAPQKQTQLFGVPCEQYKKIRARWRAQACEMRVLGDTGAATLADLTVIWTYSESEQLLTVTCTKRPWWISESRAAARIRDLVEGGL